MQPFQYGQNYPVLPGPNQPGPNQPGQNYPAYPGPNQHGPNQPGFNQPGPNNQYGRNQPGPNQPGPNTLNRPEVFNELSKKQKAALVSHISPKESIFYAGVVDKVNKHQAVQRRILAITDKALYNIDDDVSFFESLALCHSFDGYAVRRKININKIFGATVSTNPISEKEQFIVHVQGEHDYLYNGGTKRDRIIKSLMNAHFATSNQPFVLFCRDEANLSKFHTTDDDVSAKKDKRPKEGRILVTPDLIKNGLGWIIFNKNNLVQNPNTNTINIGFNMPPHPNQGNFGGAPYGGPYNGPGNFPGPHQNQGPAPNAGGFYPPQNGPVNNNQGSFYSPGPQSYQPYPQGPYANMNLPPVQQQQQQQQPPTNQFNQFNPQNQAPGGQFSNNYNQPGNGFNPNGAQPNGNSNTSPNVNKPNNNQNGIPADLKPTPVNNNTQAQINTNVPNSPISRSPTMPYNQYNNNYPPQNQNYGGQWNGRNF